MFRALISAAVAVLTLSGAALAEDNVYEFGGDWFGGGQVISNTEAVTGDVFGAGYDVSVATRVGGDAHMAGYNVRIDAPVAGNVYAGGFSVTINGPVGKDVSAMGNTVSIDDVVSGNVRAAGAVVSINAPVRGSVTAAGASIILSDLIEGDVELSGENFTFADGASVAGTILIRTSKQIEVPASVAPADRVTVEIVQPHEQAWEQTNVGVKVMTSPWVLFFGGIVWVVILLVVGLIVLAIAPRRTRRVQQVAVHKPWYSLLAGALSLAMLLGLVPVLAMTLVGIPLIPILLLLMAFVWLMTYLAAGFILGERIMNLFGRSPVSVLAKMVTLAIGLVLVWLVGMIPLIGWFAVEALMFLALGAITLSYTLGWFDPALKERLLAEDAGPATSA